MVAAKSKEHGGAGHHVHARRDHGGGVDERRDRRRARHGVGKPHVEWDLGGLTRGSEEEEEGHRRHQRTPVDQLVRSSPHDLHEVQGPHLDEDQEEGDEESEVPDAVHDERLLSRVGLLPVSEPEPDQEVGAQPHPLPPDEHHREGGAGDQDQHEEDEEIEVREVPGIARIVLHVPHAEDVDEEPDPRDHQHHDHGELVQLEGRLHPEGARVHPRPVVHHHRFVELHPTHAEEVGHHQQEAAQQDTRSHPGG
jgi:hypothetical protein